VPNVVSIQVSGGGERGTGSGFVIRDDGYILTNNHVVAPAASGGDLQVQYNDGTSTPGTIVGHDPFSDVAVVRVPKRGLKALPLGNSDDVAVGDPVVAIGSPLGLSGTVTSGIVSALDRPVAAGDSSGTGENQAFLSAIQTDAAINPGNSGGPLVDGAGRVIGIDSAIATLPGSGGQAGSIGLGFAIPINQAKRIATELISTGHALHTVIGASLATNSQTTGDGAELLEVPSGPAKDAGLRPGDVIVKFGRQRVTDGVDLIAAIRSKPPQARVVVTYRRDGQQRTATVTLRGARG
jgi:putative serine protease PepD